MKLRCCTVLTGSSEVQSSELASQSAKFLEQAGPLMERMGPVMENMGDMISTLESSDERQDQGTGEKLSLKLLLN